MKKFLAALMLTGAMAATLTGCNKQMLDVTYNFDRAIISLPNGEVIEGNVDSWKDYEGDQLQVKINGVTYLVHSSDAVLIAK